MSLRRGRKTWLRVIRCCVQSTVEREQDEEVLAILRKSSSLPIRLPEGCCRSHTAAISCLKASLSRSYKISSHLFVCPGS